MKTQDIIKYLKNSVLGDMVTHENEIGETVEGINLFDPEFNQTDEQLEEVLKFMTYKVGRGGEPIESLPNSLIHPLVLFAKRELYLKLAIKNSPLFDITSDTISLNKGQRFNHYYVLIQLLDAEINDLESTGAFTFIETGETLLDGKYYLSRRNYELSECPKVELSICNLYNNKVEFEWTKFNTEGAKKFRSYEIYIHTSPVVDEFDPDNLICREATLVREITNIHTTKLRVDKLLPNTKYYLAVKVTDLNNLSGVSQVEFTTKEV